MDQQPPKRYWNKDFIQKEKVGRNNRRYYKRGPGYICSVCPYASNKTCGKCIYARWNVDGIVAGFSPSRAYREAHKDEISASPLMMQFDGDPRLTLIPRAASLRLPVEQLDRPLRRLVEPTVMDSLQLVGKLAHVKKVIG